METMFPTGQQQQQGEAPQAPNPADVTPEIPEATLNGDAPATPPKPETPRVLKRNLKTRDVRYVLRIWGEVQKQTQNTLRERFPDANAFSQQEIMSFLLTDGIDYAAPQLNGWLADLCNITPESIGLAATASEQERVKALNDYMDDMDLDFLSNVFADLVEFGGLEAFLTQVMHSWNQLPWGQARTSTG